MNTVGYRIKYFRDTHVPPLTQEELALESGIKMGTLSNYEANIRNPSRKAFRKLAFVFGVRWEVLDPVETPVFNPNNAASTSEICTELCSSMNAFEKDTLKKYCSIPEPQRTGIYKRWDKDIDTALKKSAGHGDQENIKNGAA